MWWIFALLSALFAALTGVFAKVGIKNVNTDLAIAIRTSVIIVMVWAIAYLRGGASQVGLISRTNLIFLTLSGITTGLSWIFYFKALETGNLSQVAPVDKLSLALMIIFSVVFLGETLTLKTAIGAACVITGTLVLVL